MTLRELLLAVGEVVEALFAFVRALLELALDTRLETYALIFGVGVGALLALWVAMQLADFFLALGGASRPWLRDDHPLRGEDADADAWGFRSGRRLRRLVSARPQ